MNVKQDISQDEFDRIEKFITHQMTEKEKANFEKEVNTNPLFKAKFDEIKDITEGIERAELKEMLDKFHQEMEEQEKNHRKKLFFLNRKFLSVAASFLIIVFISTLLLVRPNKNQRLFAEYFSSDPGLVTAMSAKDKHYEFERGMVDFKTKNYNDAVNRWAPLASANPANDTLNYFLGVAYLELEETDSAIVRLEKATTVSQSKFINEAYWYLALAYILENRKEDAANALQNTNHPSKTKLLNELNEK